MESSDQPGTFITARTYSVILDLDTHSEGYPSFIDLLFLLLLLLAVSNLSGTLTHLKELVQAHPQSIGYSEIGAVL